MRGRGRLRKPGTMPLGRVLMSCWPWRGGSCVQGPPETVEEVLLELAACRERAAGSAEDAQRVP
eukprot:11223261-Lingulodinium_polyedra.AAC.1